MRRLVLAVLALVVLLAPARAGAAGLPLGPRWLPEQRSTHVIAPGVLETEITRGFASPRDVYTVEVAFVGDRGAAHDLRVRLRAAATTRASPVSGGFSVRTGAFADQAAADALREVLATGGFAGGRTLYTGEDGRRTTGPWRVHVLSVDPVRFAGSLVPALGTGVVPGREPLSVLAARTGAIAGVNGGSFVIGAENGTDGDLAGISEVHGALSSPRRSTGRRASCCPTATARAPASRRCEPPTRSAPPTARGASSTASTVPRASSAAVAGPAATRRPSAPGTTSRAPTPASSSSSTWPSGPRRIPVPASRPC